MDGEIGLELVQEAEKLEEIGFLWEYIDKAAQGGPRAKTIFIAVTSKVEGKIKSEGLSFGQGKSLFACILEKQIFERYDSVLGLEPWEAVKDNIGYTWKHHIAIVEQAAIRRKVAYTMDDLQRIAGKSKSRDIYVQSWAEFLSTARPFMGVVIFTCPSVGELAKCFRELVNFEIKIPYEGYYEVQFLKAYSDYSRPLEPLLSMKYKGENTIPRAPEHFIKWYIDWRKESSLETFRDRIVNWGEKNKKQKTIAPTFRDFSNNYRENGGKMDDHELQIIWNSMYPTEDTTTLS